MFPFGLRLLMVFALSASLGGCARRVVTLETPLEQMTPVPPGMVDVNITSDDRRVWDVYSGDVKLCQTPCSQRLAADQDLLLKSPPRGPRLYLPDLGPEAIAARRAVVVAEYTRKGERAAGITFTALGGMGLVVGITLTAVGCSDVAERGGMCTAGLIVGGISAALTTGAIILIVDALAKVHVLPVR
jgi:hypothetical protein